MNKYDVFGGIGVLGILTYGYAALAKLTHNQFGEEALIVSLMCIGISAAALVWFLFQYLKRKNL